MKWNSEPTLTALSLITLGSTSVLAQNHRRYGDGMQQWDGASITAEQQAAAQKVYNGYCSQTNASRQQLTSRHYKYNVLLTASPSNAAKISAIAEEMEALNQSLNEQRAKRDVAMMQADMPHDAGTGYDGCDDGGNHHNGSHMGVNR